MPGFNDLVYNRELDTELLISICWGKINRENQRLYSTTTCMKGLKLHTYSIEHELANVDLRIGNWFQNQVPLEYDN